jgi:hypothetical protein
MAIAPIHIISLRLVIATGAKETATPLFACLLVRPPIYRGQHESHRLNLLTSHAEYEIITTICLTTPILFKTIQK